MTVDGLRKPCYSEAKQKPFCAECRLRCSGGHNEKDRHFESHVALQTI